MIDDSELNNILATLINKYPIRIWAYDTYNNDICTYIEGYGNNPIYNKLDALPNGMSSYRFVIKIGMGN